MSEANPFLKCRHCKRLFSRANGLSRHIDFCRERKRKIEEDGDSGPENNWSSSATVKIPGSVTESFFHGDCTNGDILLENFPECEAVDGNGGGSESDNGAAGTGVVDEFPDAGATISSTEAVKENPALDPGDPLYPFASEEELWFTTFTQMKPKLSNSRIDFLLQGVQDAGFGAKFATGMRGHHDLNCKLDVLVHHLGPVGVSICLVPESIMKLLRCSLSPAPLSLQEWRSFTLNVDAPGKSYNGELTLYYVDAKVALEKLFARRDLKDHMAYAPRKLYDSDGNRLYGEPHTGDRWHDIQRALPPNATVWAVMGGSDATQLSVLGGDKKAWPVYVSLGNITLKVRRAHRNECFVLVGYLPFLEGDRKEASTEHFRYIKRDVYHRCLRKIFQPLMDCSRKYVY